ncbi:hypothetical protein [Streptomyces sp. NPDC047123]|uniref:hypothetical protein n=1 Tax=Streptomyces sp. NPDC047123 TaxID=3155622 RepID=UPI0033E64379
MRTQIITALVGVGGTGLGASLALIGTAWQARITARSKAQELAQSREQAYIQLHVDHVGQRLENRRGSYLEFSKAVAALTKLTRVDAIEAAQRQGDTTGYQDSLGEAAAEIEAARNAVLIDGPQAVATQAAELCRIPYRLAELVDAVCGETPGSEPHQRAREAADELRTELIRELVRFSVMASAALNLDGVGNHLGPLNSPTPASP